MQSGDFWQLPANFLWVPLKVEHSRILKSISLAAQATIQDVVPSRSCASTEWHGACPQRWHLQSALRGAGKPLGSASLTNMTLARVACMAMCITLVTHLWPGAGLGAALTGTGMSIAGLAVWGA